MTAQNEDDSVTVTLTLSRKAYEKARELGAEKDPRRSILGEYAGLLTAEEFLSQFLETHLEEMQ